MGQSRQFCQTENTLHGIWLGKKTLSTPEKIYVCIVTQTCSYDCDRYDRGCLISLHHAIQQSHYLKPRPNKVILTTDFKLAPKTATQAKQWINSIKVDEVREIES